MAQGLFSKARTFVLGNLHELLDEAIDLNSTAAIKQHLRDLNEAKREMTTSVNVAGGRVDVATSEIASIERLIAETTENIEFVLGDGDESNDHMAEPLEVTLMGYEEDLKVKLAAMGDLQQTLLMLQQTNSKLASRYASMSGQLSRLESMEHSNKAANAGLDALEKASEAMSTGVGANVDSVAKRLEEEAATTKRRFVQMSSELEGDASNDLAAIKAKQRLAARRAKMAGGATAAASTEKNASTETV